MASAPERACVYGMSPTNFCSIKYFAIAKNSDVGSGIKMAYVSKCLASLFAYTSRMHASIWQLYYRIAC